MSLLPQSDRWVIQRGAISMYTQNFIYSSTIVIRELKNCMYMTILRPIRIPEVTFRTARDHTFPRLLLLHFCHIYSMYQHAHVGRWQKILFTSIALVILVIDRAVVRHLNLTLECLYSFYNFAFKHILKKFLFKEICWFFLV
jgi:hypothetical protein